MSIAYGAPFGTVMIGVAAAWRRGLAGRTWRADQLLVSEARDVRLLA